MMADSAILPTKGCEGEVSRKGNSDFTLKEWLVSLVCRVQHRFSLGGCRDEAFLWLFKSGLQLSELKNVEIVISDTEMERLRVLRFQTEVDGLQVPADVPFLEQCFWVHIHGLPSVFTTKEMGEVIVAAMGRCVTVDCENDLCFDEFMHIKVAIDVFKPLRRGVQLRLPSLEGSGLIEVLAGQSAGDASANGEWNMVVSSFSPWLVMNLVVD
ncbi:hypothetical protein ACFX13_035299 [Malus domestica]